MAITQGNLIFDGPSENLGDLKALDDCTLFVNGIWKASGLCNGGSSLQARVGLVNFPIPANVRIIGVTIGGGATGVSATTQIGFGPSTNPNEYNNTIVGIDNGGFSHSWSENITDYGQPLNFIAGINYDTRNNSAAYITSIVFDTLVDDSLSPSSPPPGTPPPDNTVGCIPLKVIRGTTNISCPSLEEEFIIQSQVDNQGNSLIIEVDNPIGLLIIGVSHWNPNTVTPSKYLIAEQPLGRETTSYNIATNPLPYVPANIILLNKLTIYGPNTQENFSVNLKIVQSYTQAELDSIPPGTQFGDIFSGLSGIVDAINDEKSTLDDTIHNGLFDLKSILANISTDLPQGLVASFISSLTGIPQNVTTTLLSNFKIPPELVQDLIKFINTIITSEGIAFTQFAKSAGQTTKVNFDSNIVRQNQSFEGTLSAQERVVNNLLEGKYADADSFFSDLKSAGNDVALIEWLQNAYLIIFGTIGFLKAKTNIADIVTTQILLGEYTPNINDLGTLVTDYFKGAISLTELQNYAKRYGLDISKVTELISAQRPLPNLQEIREGFVRGFIVQSQHDKYLQQYGFGQDDIAFIKTLYNVQLGPSDVTRIADKHIYSNDIPTIFGQYTEIDQGYLDAMSKLGISADQTNKLWAAHWSLTGLQDTFSMYHRGLIDDNELNTWFALTDIMPFFREKLKQLNYALVTRVDIRRFYSEGLYNEQQVTQAYKKLGFSDSDAQLQTAYTVQHERDSENPTKVKIKTLTETMVVKAFKRGIISNSEAINRLGQVGYLPGDAQLVLRLETQIDSASLMADKTQHYHDKLLNHILASLSKGTVSEEEARSELASIGVPQAEIESEISYSAIERVLQLKEFVEQHIRTAYTSGQIDKPTAINLMGDIGFNINEITYLFEELDLVKQLRSKALTETQLKDIYTAGVIDRDTLYSELQNLGYSDKHAQWLTDTIAPQGV